MENNKQAPNATLITPTTTQEEIENLVAKAAFMPLRWRDDFRADLYGYRDLLRGKLAGRGDLYLDPEDTVSIKSSIAFVLETRQ